MNPDSAVLERQQPPPPVDDIVIWPARILQKKTARVDQIDGKLIQLVIDMLVTLKKLGGLGLAAPQIGVNKSLLVYAVEDQQGCMINPKLLESSEETESNIEGCLSLPGIFVRVPRSKKVKVKWTDIDGNDHEEELEGQLARAVQHELDHLEGKTIISNLSKLKRDMIAKKAQKAHKHLVSTYIKEKPHGSSKTKAKERQKKNRKRRRKR